MSNVNNARDYTMSPDPTKDTYTRVADGGALFGLGCKYSQYNSGQDFSAEQWGISLDTNLSSDNPISVFLYFKAATKLVWSPAGVQVIS